MLYITGCRGRRKGGTSIVGYTDKIAGYEIDMEFLLHEILRRVKERGHLRGFFFVGSGLKIMW
jgi:hypothetical protein